MARSRAEFWGVPITGPVAPEEALTVLRREWRTATDDDRAEIEALARAVQALKDGMKGPDAVKPDSSQHVRAALAELHERAVAPTTTADADTDRAEQLTRWHTDDHAGAEYSATDNSGVTDDGCDQ